jgi:hypothetical protein
VKEVLQPLVQVHTTPPSQGAGKKAFSLTAGDFLAIPKGKKNGQDGPYLILGFDTEFKGPGYAVNRDDIKAGKAKFRVLSYQFHAKTSDGKEWNGICCPEGDERMTLGEFIVFALGVGAREQNVKDLPTTIYLVGHFTRADIPAFADFRDQYDFLSSVRSTIVSVDTAKPYTIEFPDGATVDIQVRIRDTMLLTPQMSKSLGAIGELVGVPKLTLHPDKAKHQEMIERMDYVRENNWEQFREYALNDALICVRYIERIIDQYRGVTGKMKVPVTLTSIGVDLLLKSWREKLEIDPLEILGKEKVTERFFDKKRNYYRKVTREIDLVEVNLYNPFGIESYHGGRNEQFWFGPCFEDQWTDYDLSSAYPTAMSMIGKPKWKEIRDTTCLDDFTYDNLGLALVEFEFPDDTRYPTMPVRTDNGLIFPLSGTTFCPSPEIAVARNLGAKLKILRGIVIPTDKDVAIFGSFIKECLEHRKAAGSKTLAGLVWKEISNSTYGKTAQGLREKRVYDMRALSTKVLPPSRITNPFFAAYITSYVRAVLGEIMNSLKHPTTVFSCTTDGFITNACPDEIERAQQGPLARLFAQARKELTNDPRVLEIKHEIRQPLGWRTRGQATLKPGLSEVNGEDYNIVLAKGGIFTQSKYDSDRQQNEYITKLFFGRDPNLVLEVEALTGIRDIVENDADLVGKLITKRLNMEFDWKRRPLGLGESQQFKHVLFSTQPWRSVEQFQKIRGAWDDYTRTEKACIKNLMDFDRFATYIETRAALPKKVSRFLKRDRPDIHRLRQMLCSAWHEGIAGFTRKDRRMTARDFATALDSMGVPCQKTDVENGKKRMFVPRFCPPTPAAKEALSKLSLIFPSLKAEQFLCLDVSQDAVSIRPTMAQCPHVQRCLEGDSTVTAALTKAAQKVSLQRVTRRGRSESLLTAR